MVDAMERVPGNPSGSHRWAREARRLLDDARDVVADVVGCEPGEVVFTSGGTEADNLAVTGIATATGGRPVCLATDHHAALAPVLAAGGTTVGVHADGRADLDALAATLCGHADKGATADDLDRPARAGTAPMSVVSLALVNNETGVVQDMEAVAAVLRSLSPETALHVDAVAAAAWLDLRPVWSAVHALSISGHKVGGPKGIGALTLRHGTSLRPGLRGGPQERERRAGTPNIAGAVGLTAALAASASARDADVVRVGALRDCLATGLLRTIDGSVRTGAGALHVANIVHMLILGVEREPLLFLLDEAGVAASAGSSCASGASEPSHVLAAMGVPSDLAAGALRLSLGWSSTDADVDLALGVVPEVAHRVRGGGRGGAGAPERGRSQESTERFEVASSTWSAGNRSTATSPLAVGSPIGRSVP